MGLKLENCSLLDFVENLSCMMISNSVVSVCCVIFSFGAS